MFKEIFKKKSNPPNAHGFGRRFIALVMAVFMAAGAFGYLGNAAAKPKLNKTSVILVKGQTEKLTVKNAGSAKVTWKSSNKKVATVGKTGKIKAVGKGKTTVTATVKNSKSEKVLKCTVKVETPRLVNAKNLKKAVKKLSLKAGKTATLKLHGNTQKVKWSSSNKKIATVSKKGKVTGKKAGTVTIKATTASGKTYKCKVTVTGKGSSKPQEKPRAATVRKISVNPTAASVEVGEALALEAHVSPADAAGRTLTWTSSDEKVATVKGGKVTGKAAGKAVITAAADGVSDSCTVTVKEKVIGVTEVTLDKKTISGTKGGSAKLTATVKPDNATDKTVTWTSSDKEIATVKNGEVTFKGVGSAVITAAVGKKNATCLVVVEQGFVDIKSITLDKTSIALTAGEKSLIRIAQVTPSDHTVDAAPVWTSSNPSVATVSGGTVTAKAPGSAVITVKRGSASASCTVSVKAAVVEVSLVSMSKTSMEMNVGDTAILRATVTPDNATDKTVTWTSSNEKVATVSGGTVTAKAAGTATVTAKAGKKTATCQVTVQAKIVGGREVLDETHVRIDGVTFDISKFPAEYDTERDTRNRPHVIPDQPINDADIRYEINNGNYQLLPDNSEFEAATCGASLWEQSMYCFVPKWTSLYGIVTCGVQTDYFNREEKQYTIGAASGFVAGTFPIAIYYKGTLVASCTVTTHPTSDTLYQSMRRMADECKQEGFVGGATPRQNLLNAVDMVFKLYTYGAPDFVDCKDGCQIAAWIAMDLGYGPVRYRYAYDLSLSNYDPFVNGVPGGHTWAECWIDGEWVKLEVQGHD